MKDEKKRGRGKKVSDMSLFFLASKDLDHDSLTGKKGWLALESYEQGRNKKVSSPFFACGLFVQPSLPFLRLRIFWNCVPRYLSVHSCKICVG